MSYYVYILKSQKDGTYYIGSTRDIEELKSDLSAQSGRRRPSTAPF
ncbi:MAG: GIY-YIG nuclease family protein [Desulfobacteraceae bacterium]|nr:GIY-YIG nuclease family protein [Desulfobacteraceae bacterium]